MASHAHSTLQIGNQKKPVRREPAGFLKSVCVVWVGLDGNSFGQLDVDATTVFVEVDVAIDAGVDGVVFTHVDVNAWVPFCSALADDDVSRNNDFTAEFLDAETFAA